MADAREFGRRLRQERERRKISLASISTTSKINVALLEGLERDDVSRWPSGIFRRSFVRSYAEAIGLDGDSVVREFLERFPDPEIVPAAPEEEPRPVAVAPKVRLRVVDAIQAFRRGVVLPDTRRRWAAAACDIGLIVAVAIVAFLMVGRFWEPAGVLALGYYGGGILVLGNTPGVCLFASDPVEHRE